MRLVSHIFCCYHPDFIQDGDTYRILNTGKYVVEWDEIKKEKKIMIFFKTLYSRNHFKKEFLTVEEAEDFMNILHKREKVFD